MDELSALRYCEQLLEARERQDIQRAWLWSVKRKVARHFVCTLSSKEAAHVSWLARATRACLGRAHRSHETAGEPAGADLTDQEKDLIRRTHPLLQDTHTFVPDYSAAGHHPWYWHSRRKISRFAAARRGPAQAGEDREGPPPQPA